jgi:NADH-quinone oxidoreductase subunit N
MLVLVGYAFEIAVAPFHLWAPDAFQGATAPVAGFLSVVPKIAGLGALVRILVTAFPGGLVHWPMLVAGLAACTMTYGNLVALRQTSLKRLLAFSTVAQAGYLLMGVAAIPGAPQADGAVAYYLAAFLLMNLAAFGVVAMIERRLGHDASATLNGLGRRAPWTAGALTLALLSLAGIPPLAGFAGKILLLSATLEAGLAWLAVAAAVNMLIGLVYYVRLIGRMYFTDAASGPGPQMAPTFIIAVGAATLGTVVLGIWPALVLQVLGISAPSP